MSFCIIDLVLAIFFPFIPQKEQLKVSEDDVASLKIKLKEMLDLAEDCFKQASLCEGDGDEEWLVHYMLGKVAEKRSLIEESLRYYFQVSWIDRRKNEPPQKKKIGCMNVCGGVGMRNGCTLHAWKGGREEITD